MRIAVVVTGASNIASVASINQGQPNKTIPTSCNIGKAGIDSLGNKIYNEDPKGVLIFTNWGSLLGGGDILQLTLPIVRSGKIEFDGFINGRWTGTPAVEVHGRAYIDGVVVQDGRIDAYIQHLLPNISFRHQDVLAAGSRVVKLNSYATNGGLDFVTGGWRLKITPGIV